MTPHLRNIMKSLTILSILIFKFIAVSAESGELEADSELFSIEGKVEVVTTQNKDWISNTVVLVEGGEYLTHLRTDGSFVIHGIPSGSYVVEVSNSDYIFEATRVDINAKGKKRGRQVNYLQPNNVKTVAYPLEYRDRRKASYFQGREQWKITDFLFNPMVLTMVLPLLMIMVLPKMMNAADPDAQKEMQSQMKAFQSKSSMPEISELFTGLFGGESKKKNAKAVKRK